MNIYNFCKKINMEKDALDFFVMLNKKIEKLGIDKDLIHLSESIIYGASDTEYLRGLDMLSTVAEKNDIHKFSLHFLFLIYGFILVEKKYNEANINENIYLDTASDIFYKMRECKEVYGVYGTFVAWWYKNFFRLNIIKLGRLEFEKRKIPFERYNKFGIDVKKGEMGYAIHIPSSGPLDFDELVSSLKTGYNFFKLKGNVPFIVHSWIILKENKDILPPNGNLKKFYDSCDILYNDYEDGYSDCWRIFNCNYGGDPNKLEQKTNLQKNIVTYLKKGGKMGEGMGVLVFDGEKILTNLSSNK